MQKDLEKLAKMVQAHVATTKKYEAERAAITKLHTRLEDKLGNNQDSGAVGDVIGDAYQDIRSLDLDNGVSEFAKQIAKVAKGFDKRVAAAKKVDKERVIEARKAAKLLAKKQEEREDDSDIATTQPQAHEGSPSAEDEVDENSRGEEA